MSSRICLVSSDIETALGAGNDTALGTDNGTSLDTKKPRNEAHTHTFRKQYHLTVQERFDSREVKKAIL